MARKQQPITHRLFYGGEQVDSLPPEAIRSIEERGGKALGKYCSEHPEALKTLIGKPYFEITYYDEKGNPTCAAT